MNSLLNNPPSFLNADDFSLHERNLIPNPESLDIFADLSWSNNNSNNNNDNIGNNNNDSANNILRSGEPLVQEQTLQTPQVQTVQPSTIPQVSSVSTTESLKKDIIKYLYNKGSCAYLQSCFSKIEDIDTINDAVLYKKFKTGLLIDSILGRNGSEKNIASYIFTFFEVLLTEAKKFTPADIQKYIDVFSTSLQKDKITILNDSGSNIISRILASNDVDEIFKSVQDNDSPSMKALKSSLQNISLLVSLTLTKRFFTPHMASLFKTEEPPIKKLKNH